MSNAAGVSRTTIEQAQLAERLRAPKGKVWGYLRVSGEKQDEHSFEIQKAGIIAFCKQQQFAEPQFVQEIASAKNPAIPVVIQGAVDSPEASPRPLLIMLLGFLCDQPGAHLIVWRLDRLARLSYEQEMLLSILTRKHVRVHSTQAGEQDVLDQSKDSDDPARALFRQMLAAVAQYERRLIEIRMKTGIRMKASKGEWVGGGMPFGYIVKGGELAIHPEKADLVRRIFYLRFRCDETYTKIAELIDKHLRTTTAAGETRRLKWHKVRVKRVLDNRQMYEGIYVDPYNVAHERPDLRVLPTNEGEWDAWATERGMVPAATLDDLNYANPET